MQKAGGSFLRNVVKKISNGIQSMKSSAPGKIFTGLTHELKPISDVVNVYKPIIHATKNFVKGTQHEYESIKQLPHQFHTTKKSINEFIKHPSVKHATNALVNTGKLATKPHVIAAREVSNISDFASKIPGLREAKM